MARTEKAMLPALLIFGVISCASPFAEKCEASAVQADAVTFR